MSFSLLMLLFFPSWYLGIPGSLKAKHRGWTWLGLGLSVLAAIMFVAVVFLRSCF
jgi:hypothetical protein